MILKRSLSWTLVVSEIRFQLLLSIAISVAAYYLDRVAREPFAFGNASPLTIMGAGLSIFLSFRNNTAYARWWEARGLWGEIVNSSRKLTRYMLAIEPDPSVAVEDPVPARSVSPEGEAVLLRLVAWCHALARSLRGEEWRGDLGSRVGEEIAREAERLDNPAAALLLEMGARIGDLHARGRLDSQQQLLVESALSALTDAQGGCERIRNTPLPPQYDTFPRIIVYLFVYLLPFGIVDALGFKTMIVAPLVAFLFLVLEAAGRDIEDPFSGTIHDTPMTALATMIETEIRHVLGHTDRIPTPIVPKRGYLM